MKKALFSYAMYTQAYYQKNWKAEKYKFGKTGEAPWSSGECQGLTV